MLTVFIINTYACKLLMKSNLPEPYFGQACYSDRQSLQGFSLLDSRLNPAGVLKQHAFASHPGAGISSEALRGEVLSGVTEEPRQTMLRHMKRSDMSHCSRSRQGRQGRKRCGVSDTHGLEQIVLADLATCTACAEHWRAHLEGGLEYVLETTPKIVH